MIILKWYRKNLLKEILKQYPSVNEEELKNLIRVKDSEISYSKIVTHDSVDLIVYFSDKIPYFFKAEKDDQLIPTGISYSENNKFRYLIHLFAFYKIKVYFLWKFPNILSKFYTHKEVFSRLAKGADLMMPGLIVNQPVNLYTFKHIKKNDLVSICLDGNE
jgi:predicted ribosome-associated RNA-binding protein Tma20